MADLDLHAALAQALGVVGVGEIAAAHLVAEIVQGLGDAAHADAADPDEVDDADIERKRPHQRASPARLATTSASRSAASMRARPRALSAVRCKPAPSERIAVSRAARTCGEASFSSRTQPALFSL